MGETFGVFILLYCLKVFIFSFCVPLVYFLNDGWGKTWNESQNGLTVRTNILSPELQIHTANAICSSLQTQ